MSSVKWLKPIFWGLKNNHFIFLAQEDQSPRAGMLSSQHLFHALAKSSDIVLQTHLHQYQADTD